MQRYNTATSEVILGFRFPSVNDPALIELKILAAIALDPETEELEKVKIIVSYTHNLFGHDGNNQPSASDPLTIIKEARAGKSFSCVEYSLVATALLWAYGVPARVIGLKTSDVETREYGAGHVVIEFWSREFEKWIMGDVQWGIIPRSGNVFLSAWELGEKIHQKLPVECVLVDGSRFDQTFKTPERYTNDWIQEYLYFFDTPVQITFADIDRRKQQIAMLVPLGVKSPVTFQGRFEMNAVYAHSTLDFYPKM